MVVNVPARIHGKGQPVPLLSLISVLFRFRVSMAVRALGLQASRMVLLTRSIVLVLELTLDSNANSTIILVLRQDSA